MASTRKALGPWLTSTWEEAERSRQEIRDEMIKDLRQYVGIYDPETLRRFAPNANKSFIRVTRTKVKTLDVRVGQLAFPNLHRNWNIIPTPIPLILDPKSGKTLEVSTLDSRETEGIENSAKLMTLIISDQLKESHFRRLSRNVRHSGHLYGTGILKGPLVQNKTRVRWVSRGGGPRVAIPVTRRKPFLEFTRVWDFYPDMEAATMEDARYVFQRHLFDEAKLRQLAYSGRPDIRRQEILNHMKKYPTGDALWKQHETDIMDVGRYKPTGLSAGSPTGKWEVIEFWGFVPVTALQSAGIPVPAHVKRGDLEANIWFFPNGSLIIKGDINPSESKDRPYSFYIPDREEGKPFGVSLPYNLRDTQDLINASVRVMVDNAANSSGPQWEFDVDRYAGSDEGADITDMRPNRVWPVRARGFNTPALRAIETSAQTGSYMAMINVFKSLGDEAVAMPSFQHGEKSPGVGRTAKGLGMLMGNAQDMLRDPLDAWDEFQEDVIRKLYHWNMQFNETEEAKGDFDVAYQGSMSVSAKQERAQSLMQLLQMSANPLDAQFTKRREILKEIAEALEIQNRFIKTDEELEAEISQMQQETEEGAPSPEDFATGQTSEGIPE